MKKDKYELLRLQTLIENDRVNMSDDFMSLVESDAEKLLKDYFDFSTPPKLSIAKFGDKYKVQLNVVVVRLKNFGTVPKN
jgi:hypothetical protein